MRYNLLESDLDYVFKYTQPLWEELREQRIFITGGTGFFGCWLLESFIWANDKLKLNASAVILTRDKRRYAKKYPHLFQHPALDFYEGDVRNFKFSDDKFSHIIHAATDVNPSLNRENPLLVWETIVLGTKNILDFAISCNAKKILLVSSGAVYGTQQPEISNIPENWPCQPGRYETQSAYALGKFSAENIATLYAKQYGLNIKIARCFAFIGPFLALDSHYAIGNFIRDAILGKAIVVQGDGTPYRSYLYATDLAIWLWTILFQGKTSQPYNVGSNEEISISDLAHLVAKLFKPNLEVKILKYAPRNILPERYVPNVDLAREELGLVNHTDLKSAIEKTIKWHLESEEKICK